MPKRHSFSHGQNNLIATLTAQDRALIDPHLTAVELDRGLTLEEPGKAVETIYFPSSGVASMVAAGHEGRRIEVGLFGREGMSGTAVVLEAEWSPNTMFVQVPGHGSSIEVGRLRELLAASPGKRVYMFTTDTQGDGSEPAISCTSQDCLDAWPLVTAEGEVTVGPELDVFLASTFPYEGKSVVTYNGWPLYTFARDEAGQPPQGQDVHSFGGEWYLPGPQAGRSKKRAAHKPAEEEATAGICWGRSVLPRPLLIA